MKKVFLSLATIAFVAAGSLTVTSCGGDDSVAPGPDPGPEKLTENFIEVDGTQTATTETRWYVRCNGNTAAAPIIEYTLSETDPTLYAIYDLVTFDSADNLINVIYAVKIDESKATAADGRYYYPYTSETFSTVLLSAYYVDAAGDSEFGDDFKITPTALSYQDKTMTYTASGTADSKVVSVNYTGTANSMYILDMSAAKGAAKGVFSKVSKADFSKASLLKN